MEHVQNPELQRFPGCRSELGASPGNRGPESRALTVPLPQWTPPGALHGPPVQTQAHHPGWEGGL